VVTLRNPKGTSPDLPLQKFNSHRVWIVNYSVSLLGCRSMFTQELEFL
jgi:hypothetical protein